MAMRTKPRGRRGPAVTRSPHARRPAPAARRRAPAKSARPSGNGRTAGRASTAPAAPKGADWARQREAWEKRYAQTKERPGLYPFTISGIPIKPLYTPEDVAGIDLPRDLAFPGEYPYTRGVHTSMFRGRMFTMRQFSGFATPRESNQRYHSLLGQGQTGLSIAFDNPTIMGYDSDHPKSHGEVGKCGVAVDSLRDMEILLGGIDPGTISTSMTINGPASIMFGFYLANAFHEYVIRILVGMGWVVVEEREEYETLKYIYTSPVGIFVYLWGRSTVKFVQATVSVILILTMGWLVLGLRWEWSAVRWAPLILSFLLGLTAVVYFGFLVAGWALVLPRAAISVNEGVAAALTLLCGVLFPIDLLPRAVQTLSLVLPFTWWYEALRRFLLGHGASTRMAAYSDGWVLGALAITTIVLSAVSVRGYHALEDRARRLGKLDQSTLF
jgi:ABC-type multidrug transport system permease subunit